MSIPAHPAPPVSHPRERIALALSILNHRPAVGSTIELAAMALRGADIATLMAADAQMRGVA